MKLTLISIGIVIAILLSNNIKADGRLNDIEVRFLQDGITSPAAKIESLAWMQGRWKSDIKVDDMFGGAEHTIFAPHDGQMPGLVLVMNSDKSYMMFELSSFLEVDGTLTYRNRHFGTDLTAMQQPNDFVDRRLVALEAQTVYFHGITFTSRGKNKMSVAFVLTDDNGKRSKHQMDYSKVNFN